MVLKYIIIIQIILFLFVKTDISAQSTYDQTLEECFGTYDFALYSNKDELHIDTDYLDGWLSTLWPTYSPFAIVFMAMSLGTYNASSYTCMTTFYPVNLVAALYIESNYENIALDSARGDGEHLYSLRDRWYPPEDDYGLLYTNRTGILGDKLTEIEKRACYYTHYSVYLDWNGDMLLCCQDMYNRTEVFGNVLETKLIDIWLDKKLNDFRNKLVKGERVLSPCNNCTANGMIFGESHSKLW